MTARGRLGARLTCVLVAAGLVALFRGSPTRQDEWRDELSTSDVARLPTRHLLDSASGNCSSVHDKQVVDKCYFVTHFCDEVPMQLFNYLALVYCDLSDAKPFAYIVLLLWLLLLISLLASTADTYFVPPLQLLSEQLKLSPA